MSEFENNPRNSDEKDNGIHESKQEAIAFIWETIKIVVISLAIIIPIRYYLVQPFFVKGASMESTFENKDYILIDEITYQFRKPQRGEVVVFRSPEDTSQFFIKRIIGLPDETVQIKNNKVTIFSGMDTKGFLLKENYLDPKQITEGDLNIRLNNNEYFVLGDNRLGSSDSRRWGPLERPLITGKVFIRLWPLNQIKRFNMPVY